MRQQEVKPGTTVEVEGVKYELLGSGSCLTKKLFPITNLTLCKIVAAELGLPGGFLKEASHHVGQEGCYYMDRQLWIPPAAIDTKTSAERRRELALRPTAFCRVPTEGAVEILEGDMDFPGGDFLALKVEEAAECNQKCLDIPTCTSWSWRSPRAFGNSDTCFLKRPIEAREVSPGSISGSPRPSRSAMMPYGMLYCLTVVMPLGDEQNLLKLQYKKASGIFACDLYSVYSSVEMEVVTGIYATVLQQDLNCQPGPDFHSCIFTGMFQMIWRKVTSDRQYLEYKWTVKVKPDVVFLPERLRTVLADYEANSEQAVYMNNCKFGLHGPLQVLSRAAVAVYSGMGQSCFDHADEDFMLDASADEGQFLEYCLHNVLQLTKIDNDRLLEDEHCGATDWASCSSDSVAFEPFKTTDTFGKCLQTARTASK